MKFYAALWVIFILTNLTSCIASNFSSPGSGGSQPTANPPSPSSTIQESPVAISPSPLPSPTSIILPTNQISTIVVPSPSPEYTEPEKIHQPQQCTGQGTNIGVGGKCPAASALYVMDDMGSRDTVPNTYVCCPLPAKDILAKTGAHTPRVRTCAPGEIMTGVADASGGIFCSKINANRYALQPARLACTGDGGCGGSQNQVDENTLPAALRPLVLGPLGKDGCITVPFGSLVIQQGGRRCEDSAAATLLYKDTMRPVKIFP